MIKPPPASEEAERQAVLRSYGILDTAPEREFDELVEMAAHICGMPIAKISLIDGDRQWVKAAYGVEVPDIPRDLSFCAHTILQSQPLVVTDAAADTRFADNPLVTGSPGIRFYAGVRLVTPDGYALGALCVIDRTPRQVSGLLIKALTVLSRHVMNQIELRRQEHEMIRVNNALLGILEDAQLAEAGTRESEALSRGVINSMVALIAVVDQQGTIIAVNDALKEFSGETCCQRGEDDPEFLTRTEVGINYLEVCRTGRGQTGEACRGLQAVLSGEQDHFAFEYACCGRWFLMSVTPLKTRRGGATISHLEITERKLAGERIAEQAALLDSARDAIMARSPDGRIQFWNQGAERLYGWNRTEVLGCAVKELLYPDPIRHDEIQAAVLEKGEWSGELRHKTRSGQEIIVEARWTLIRGPGGEVKSILGINTDITEKKRIETQFLRAQRMESIGTLAGGIAHDLNNILSPIMMAIDILKTTSTDPQAGKILDTIGISARRGADIVRQVLSFARGMEGERIELQSRHLLKDLQQIIKDTFPKDIQLSFSIPEDSWTVLGDPTQIHQVLLNLCVNARDAMPHGGDLKVTAENCVLDEQYAAMNLQARPGRYVKFRVTDAGTGIPPEIMDKIFEPFFTTKDMHKGTGLGLSTVAAIVKSHEGLINVYSELGKGTTFHVYLPAMLPSAAARKEQLEEANLPRGQGETVLLVDDESSILSVTSQTLQAFGYRVLTASDGAEALAVYAEHRHKIAVVLTDMRMPVLDGSTMIQALMRINPAVKIIAASGLDTNDSLARFSGVGVKHFLSKPYTAGTLLKTIRSVLDES